MSTSTPPFDVDELEHRIRHALHARADAFVATGTARADAPPRSSFSWRSRPALAGVTLIAVVVVALVVATTLLWRTSTDQNEPPAASTVAPTSTTESSPVPGATNVPLRAVDTPDSMRIGSAIRTMSALKSYRADDGPVVTISQVTDQQGASQCLSVESWYNAASSYAPSSAAETTPSVSSTCDAPEGGLMQVFHYPHTDSAEDATIVYVWTRVPSDAAYVVLQSQDRLLWQRPIDGVVVFPIPDNPIDAQLRAVRANGSDAGSATITKSYNGAQSLPGQLPQHLATDDRYPQCFALVGDDDLVGIYDHGTRLPVKISVAQYCDGLYGPITGALPYSDEELHSVGVIEQRVFINGKFVLTYVEYEATNQNGVVVGTTHSDKPVPLEDVQRRVEEARSTVK